MSQLKAKWIKIGNTSCLENVVGDLTVKVDDSTIERDVAGLRVKQAGITNDLLAGSISEDKLAIQFVRTDGTNPFLASQSMGGYFLTNVANPVSDQDAANKLYVDTVAQGLDLKESVKAASTQGLDSSYSNGVLTSLFNQILVIDDVTIQLNDRVLLKNQSNPVYNGIYYMSQVGDVSTPWKLTRAVDFNTSDKISPGAFMFVEGGTVSADSGYVLITNDPIILDSTNLVFSQFSGVGQIIAGDGLTKTGNQIDVDVDDVTIAITANALHVKNLGIGTSQLADNSVNSYKIASSIAGSGLSGGGGTPLGINVDNVTIGITSDILLVKDDGISTSKIADGAVRVTKLGPLNGTGIVGDWDLGSTDPESEDGYTITGIKYPTSDDQVVNRYYVDSVINDLFRVRAVEHFVLTALQVSNKYVALAHEPDVASSAMVYPQGAPTQYYGDDFTIIDAYKLSWSSLGMDGVLAEGDKITVEYVYADMPV